MSVAPVPIPRPAVRPCRVHGPKWRLASASRRGHGAMVVMIATDVRQPPVRDPAGDGRRRPRVATRVPVGRGPQVSRLAAIRQGLPADRYPAGRPRRRDVGTGPWPLGRDPAGAGRHRLLAAIPAPASRRSPVPRSRELWPLAPTPRRVRRGPLGRDPAGVADVHGHRQLVAHTVATDGPACERSRLVAIRQVMARDAHGQRQLVAHTVATDGDHPPPGRDPAGAGHGPVAPRSPMSRSRAEVAAVVPRRRHGA
jgi:hypothetical protein